MTWNKSQNPGAGASEVKQMRMAKANSADLNPNGGKSSRGRALAAPCGRHGRKAGMIGKIAVVITFFFAANSFAARYAYVINNLAETLSRINLSDGTVQNHITTLGETPNDIGYHNGYLYVVNSTSANVQKIDPENFQVVADIPLPVGSNPYSIAFGVNYAFVSGWASGVIYRINLASNSIDGDLAIGEFPEGLYYDNDILYATQTAFDWGNVPPYGQGKIAIIDPANMTLTRQVNVGMDPQAIDKIGDDILITCTGDYFNIGGTGYRYSISSGIVADSIFIGGQPASATHFGNDIYLPAGGWADHGTVYMIDYSNGQIIHGPQNPISVGLGASDIAVDSTGMAYSCDFGSDTVTKFNRDGQILATYFLGDGPNSIVILDDSQGDIAEPNIPEKTELLGCYPNPFNSQVVIEYKLSSRNGGLANIDIFDNNGRWIKSLHVETSVEPGIVLWDGRDSDNNPCASGVYFARLASSGDGLRQPLRMILIK